MIYAAKKKDVLIQPIFKPDKTASGRLFLPEQARERCTAGIVKYIGREVIEVKLGDRVGFSGYSGTLARIGTELLIIMPEDEIDFIFDGNLDDDLFPIYQRMIWDEKDWDSAAQDVLNVIVDNTAGEFDTIRSITLDMIKRALVDFTVRGPYQKLTYAGIMAKTVEELKNHQEHFGTTRKNIK